MLPPCWVATRGGELSQGNNMIFFFFPSLIKHLSLLTGLLLMELPGGKGLVALEFSGWPWGCTHINKFVFSPLMRIYLNRNMAI